MDDVDDEVYVFVGGGLFLVEATSSLSYGGDALSGELLLDVSAFGRADGGPAGHESAGAVASAAEGVSHGVGLADE